MPTKKTKSKAENSAVKEKEEVTAKVEEVDINSAKTVEVEAKTESIFGPDRKHSVQIIRKVTLGHVPKEVMQESISRLSSTFVDNVPYRGVPTEIEKALLPEIITLPIDDKDYNKEARDFYKSLTVRVDEGGHLLNISVKNGFPVSPRDYLIYEWAKNHPHVGMTENDAKSPNVRFWIRDPERVHIEKNKAVAAKNAAMPSYLKVYNDPEATLRVLRVMEVARPDLMDQTARSNMLNSLFEKDPIAFQKVAEDKSLELKDFIAELVEKQVLTREGSIYYYADELLGKNIEQTVAYIRDETNTKLFNDLKAKLESAKATVA